MSRHERLWPKTNGRHWWVFTKLFGGKHDGENITTGPFPEKIARGIAGQLEGGKVVQETPPPQVK